MTSIRVTPCSLKDIHTLQDIAINSYGESYLHLWHDGGMWYIDKCFSEEALKTELEDDNSVFFLIHVNDDLIGFLKLNKNKALDGYSAEEALELERIYLLKSSSGKGVGKAMIDFTKQYARELEKKVVWLKAMDSSPSVAFYEQNGFVKCGTHQLDFVAMKEEYRGMYIMKLEL